VFDGFFVYLLLLRFELSRLSHLSEARQFIAPKRRYSSTLLHVP
jgi:hypothetical protein